MSNQPQVSFFLPAELVARALQALAETVHAELDALLAQPHQGAPDIKSERAFYLRQYRAFIKAAYYWGQGVRPIATERGWLVPSATRGGVVHAVERAGGVWVCGPTCEARESFHWHTALVVGIERAIEMADAEDDGLDLVPAYAGGLPTCCGGQGCPSCDGDPQYTTTTTTTDAVTFADGTPIPDEPDPAADSGFALPGLRLSPRRVQYARAAA